MRLQYLRAGEVVSTHGLRGEMKVLPWSDGPEFLKGFTKVRLDGQDYPIETCRVQKNCTLLKLRGIDTVEAAMALRGKVVQVCRSEAPADAVYVDELIGTRVFWGEKEIGRVADVLDYPGNKVYVVRGAGEYMIPAVKEFVTCIDLDRDRMDVRLIEGMEIDAD